MDTMPNTMPNTMPIQAAVQRYGQLRERLKQDYPDLDDETLTDTLEGVTELTDQLRVLVRSALDDESLAEALKLRLSDMRARMSRLEERAERKRALAAAVMREAGLPRLMDAEFTASVRPVAPGVVVTDEALIPPPYWVPQPPRLNRQELLIALKAGTRVPGAGLSNGGSTLSVRTR
jgi:hypothetical protein